MSSIRISQLNNFSNIKSEDFVPLVNSSSLTTYRVTVSSLSAWFSDSGSVQSSSWASSSLIATSASWASMSISASTANSLIWPNTTTSSFSQNSVSSSWAGRSGNSITSSFNIGTSSFSSFAKSSSWASTSSVALTASYYNFTLPNSVPPFASASLSSSWASASLSSSYANTASYVNSSPSNSGPKFINPVTVVSTNAVNNTSPYIVVNWTTYNAYSYGISNTATAVILESVWLLDGPDTFVHIPTLGIRASSSAYVYTASYAAAAAGGDAVGGTNQGVYPLYYNGGNPTFDYKITTGFNSGVTLKMIGYY